MVYGTLNSMEKAPVSNSEIGERIGLTESGVSRLRSAARRPSVSTMEAIYKAYEWDVVEQFKIANYGSDLAWSEAFERVISKDYEKKQEQERVARQTNPYGNVGMYPTMRPVHNPYQL